MDDKLKIEIIASTKPGFVLPKEKALLFGAKNAGICYTAEGWDSLKDEDISETLKRQNNTLKNGHHSVYEHPIYNLVITNLPKILAMILNNEEQYVTSEKSARFTRMNPSPKESKLYQKWIPILEKEISEKYPQIKKNKVGKLAQENARYMISVFTPTIMGHELNLRQMNYVMHWFNNFIENAKDTPFNSKLKESMDQFNSELKDFYVEELDPNVKIRKLTLFNNELPKEDIFDVVYSTNYSATFAQLAQAQRHRTIHYQMKGIDEAKIFFIPPIIEGKRDLYFSWLNDILSVKDSFPQGTIINVNERGTVEDFISKVSERLCGQAQLETMQRTKKTLEKYMEETESENPDVYNKLKAYSNGPRCTFPDYVCASPCIFGKNGLERLI